MTGENIKETEYLKLLEAGVFDFKNGYIVIHKDNDGSIRKIEFHQTVYIS